MQHTQSYKSRYQEIKRGRKRAQRRIALCSLAVLLLAVFGVWFFNREVAEEAEEAPAPAINSAVQMTPRPLAELEDTYFLELVNFRYPIRRTPDLDTFETAWPDIPAQTAYLMLDGSARAAVAEWLRQAEGAGISGILIASGYRSEEQQAELYHSVADPSLVKPPGHSEHHTGLAIDIGISGVTLEEMAGLPEVLWLAETAWEHGFILRYPEGTAHITGITFEPWHFRYVGRPHAFYMHRHNLVLEQYLDRLQARSVLHITLEGHTYEVWHQTPRDGMIYVPTHLPFHMSSDNRGGYVVTVEIS